MANNDRLTYDRPTYRRRPPCVGGNTHHWFTYYGEPGTSAPFCVRSGCPVANPKYDQDRDPYARS